jgi:hypothetical protein
MSDCIYIKYYRYKSDINIHMMTGLLPGHLTGHEYCIFNILTISLHHVIASFTPGEVWFYVTSASTDDDRADVSEM